MNRIPLTKEHLTILSEYDIDYSALDSCICLKYKAGEIILKEGDPITYLMIVVMGKAKVCSMARNGKDLVLSYYISNGIIGDIELMTNSYTSEISISAITDFECIALPYEKNAVLLRNNLAFVNRIGCELSLKLLRSSKNHVRSALYSGEERLCSYILENAHNNIFSDTLTNVSCSVGMSYRHMLRLLNQLCEDKILDKRKNGYLIVNPKKLKQRGVGEM